MDNNFIKQNSLKDDESFISMEALAGLILMGASALAMIMANSPWNEHYQGFLQLPFSIQLGDYGLAKPLLLWINDGLMAVFFFMVGLELKRELLEGQLSRPADILLPAIGALGGMLIPAGIYAAINWQDAIALKGWAIPAATDIAFALGILALLGPRVPLSLKVFLSSLAIIDDIGAILIIAFFYTAKISMMALLIAAVCLCLLYMVNRAGVESKSIYLFIGMVMWVALLKSGVHATLAGVLLAFFIPMYASDGSSPLKSLEHDLHTAVAFFILPVFAFANAGLPLAEIGFEQILHPVPLGIALGLFVGKQLGIFGLCFVAIKSGWAKLPKGMNLWSLYGTACLCGVGFTMSLFVGSLAFEETGVNLLFDERLGIILGSLLSGILGFVILRKNLAAEAEEDGRDAASAES